MRDEVPADVALRRAYHGRISRARLAIAAAADASSGAFTPAELLAAAKVLDSRVGVATVYRALAEMLETGFVEQVGVREGAALYARCRHAGHHHHLVCTRCGHVEEADCCVEEAIERASATRGFTVTAHEFNMFGLCAACSSAPRSGEAS